MKTTGWFIFAVFLGFTISRLLCLIVTDNKKKKEAAASSEPTISSYSDAVVRSELPSSSGSDAQVRFYRAFLAHEKYEVASYAVLMSYGNSRKEIEDIRWINEQKYALHLDVNSIVSLRVGRTQDTHTTTVTLTDVDGRQSTLWTTKDNQTVSGVSPY